MSANQTPCRYITMPGVNWYTHSAVSNCHWLPLLISHYFRSIYVCLSANYHHRKADIAKRRAPP